MQVRRIYVQKKEGFDVEAKEVLADLKESLKLGNLSNVIILDRYDVADITENVFKQAKDVIFSEPQVDLYFEEEYSFDKNDKVFGVESLPGQFDQTTTSLAECLQLLTKGEKPICKSGKIYILQGDLTEIDVKTIKKYIINSVVEKESDLNKPSSLEETTSEPEDIKTVSGFTHMTDEDSKKFYSEYGFAMDLADLKFCRDYFKNEEKRDPTVTEMKMIDTYWSDHCRHTTFLTRLEKIDIKWKKLQAIYDDYLKSREFVYDNKKAKDICLMDIATISVKKMKKLGMLEDLDESEEVNACSIKAEILVDGKPEEYLIMFKNETHNHPTEIEPFGGANTCLRWSDKRPIIWQSVCISSNASNRM